MNLFSIKFCLFMAIIFIIYWKIPNRYRWILLLIASGFFYAGFGMKCLFLLGSAIVVSYVSGILVQFTKNKRQKKLILTISILIFICLLFFLKYAMFLIENINTFLRFFTIQLHPMTTGVVLPVGISFYSFKILSYLIDVYRGMNPEKNFGKYALYVAFFPEISSGPIDRADTLLQEISKEHEFKYEVVTYGLKRVAWGLFKKIVVADTLAFFVDWIYGDVYSYEGLTLIIVSVFFSIQIYCDFSGYSDMAIGLAQMLDIELTENFRSPYFSRSIKEFWRRWHMSLSRWFRDYVYIPLGGNRCNKLRHTGNLLITFLVSGLWHGASWTFVIWGGLHGIAQVIEGIWEKRHCTQKKDSVWKQIIRTLVVFIFCNFAWIFFRADSLGQAIYFIFHMFCGIGNPISYVAQAHSDLMIDIFLFGKLAVMIMLVGVFDFLNRKRDVIALIGNQRTIIRWAIYVNFVFITFIFLPVKPGTDFLYFKF